MFKKAEVTSNELCDLIDISQNLLNELTVELEGTTYAFDYRPAQDLERMLVDLRK